MSPTNPAAKTFGIGTVARLTGISVHTLRMWERRYAGLKAQRTSTGRRRYGRDDVEKLSLLKALLDGGEKISQVAALDLEALRDRLTELEQLRQPVTALPSLGVLGEFVPRLLKQAPDTQQALSVAVQQTDLDRFRSDLALQPVDILVLELPTLDARAVNEVRALLPLSRAHRAIVLYSFARRAAVDELSRAGISALTLPITVTELRQALGSLTPRPRRPADEQLTQAPQSLPRDIPPSRFTRSQLATLAATSTSVECECPRHLADLVNSLGSFESYCQQCEDQNPADAELHARLRATTAQARWLMEDALHQVAEAENIAY